MRQDQDINAGKPLINTQGRQFQKHNQNRVKGRQGKTIPNKSIRIRQA